MARIVRNDKLYQQVTDGIRDDINQDVYQPGDALPSEARMIEEYGVSRTTLRQALVILRTEGLIEIRHGKGAFVRRRNAAATVLHRPRTEPLQTISEARIRRQDADATTAALIGVPEGSALYICEATATDPTTGRRVLTRTVLPFTAAEGTELEADPFPERPAQLARLSARHGKLTATEYVQARMPTPNETTALALPDITPLLETTLVTVAKGKTVLAETETTSAEGNRLAYPAK
ncbi:GntR family transcriptional regulator [Catenulispora sp. NL8]|uniref:GntR family transcriptional regulator n=1 Tax=Catenulispora pinistramenti TaxID=2705254 RepID=A0ABS5L870_9ACTN|nr:GntR family transcriptional regulator [Catenulispora pinistramenti]MBS2554432.1 GntR family transcriptional regulator [Catenulispora pinistramenti]